MNGIGSEIRKARRMTTLVLVLFAGICGTWAQKSDTESLRAPNQEDILMRTIDVDSPYFLDRLLAKYFAGEERLTDEEFHYLYYGYAFSDMYKPLEPIPAQDEVLAAVEEIMSEPTEERMRRLIVNALEVMERDPFSPNNLNLLAFAYGSLGDSINERRCFERLEGVLRTIDNSGTGVKESSPKHILWFSHAADLLHAQGKEIRSREVVSRSCEYIFLKMKDEEGNLGYYFDFSRIYMIGSDYRPEKRSTGWSINDMPLERSKE